MIQIFGAKFLTFLVHKIMRRLQGRKEAESRSVTHMLYLGGERHRGGGPRLMGMGGKGERRRGGT